jgi:three-Cys-motif partner protein
MGKARQQFGGMHTEAKLHAVSEYLQAYMTAMKNQGHWRFLYVDAFAGTGYRQLTEAERREYEVSVLFNEDRAEVEVPELKDGSARRALEVDPPFDEYFFIEKSRRKATELQVLPEDYPDLAGRIHAMQGEANAELLAILEANDWRTTRAVVFLDPTGLQVDWTTIEAISSTHAVDLWYLLPVEGLQRCLFRDGSQSQALLDKLDRFFGGGEWRDVFYRAKERPVEHQLSLFADPVAGGDGDPPLAERVAYAEEIRDYFVTKMSQCYVSVR